MKFIIKIRRGYLSAATASHLFLSTSTFFAFSLLIGQNAHADRFYVSVPQPGVKFCLARCNSSLQSKYMVNTFYHQPPPRYFSPPNNLLSWAWRKLKCDSPFYDVYRLICCLINNYYDN